MSERASGSVSWSQIAEWYDRKLGDGGDLWHRALIDPGLLSMVGDVKGLRLLDLACGNGYLSRRFARQGAKVTAIDSSGPVVKLAMERERSEPLGISYYQADAADLRMLSDATYDLAISNMALMDIEKADSAIAEVGRVLVLGGRFVASINHPCFDIEGSSAWVVERMGDATTVWRKVTRYREVTEERVPWEGGAFYTKAYHRPLSWYVRALRSAGLAVVGMEEPEPTEEFLRQSTRGDWIRVIPLHLVIMAVKRGR